MPREPIIDEAAEVLLQRGERGLREWLREYTREAPREMVLLIVDEDGDGLLGRAMPGEVRRLLAGGGQRGGRGGGRGGPGTDGENNDGGNDDGGFDAGQRTQRRSEIVRVTRGIDDIDFSTLIIDMADRGIYRMTMFFFDVIVIENTALIVNAPQPVGRPCFMKNRLSQSRFAGPGVAKKYDPERNDSGDRLHTTFTASVIYTLLRLQDTFPDPRVPDYILRASAFIRTMQVDAPGNRRHGAFHYSLDLAANDRENHFVSGTASKCIFTLLELVFREATEIPFHNGARLQAYPLASRATESRPAFPLEKFAELVHHGGRICGGGEARVGGEERK